MQPFFFTVIDMIYTTENSIVLKDYSNFSAKDILECGQIFRYNKLSDGYEVFSTDKYAVVTEQDNVVTITTDDVEYFYNFFDLDTDYGAVCNRLAARSDILRQAVEYGKGIRILNQDLTEMLFSFIISANNNIKRIQLIVNRLSENLGTKTKYGYAFPTAEQMASASVEDFARMGAGYRAPYLYDTAQKLKNGYDLSKLYTMDTEMARKELLSFKGVGPKVADCVLLFGLKKQDVFPVDTWIKKVYHNYFEQGHKDSEIACYFVSQFGEDAGLCQQYLFYFQRKYGQTK